MTRQLLRWSFVQKLITQSRHKRICQNSQDNVPNTATATTIVNIQGGTSFFMMSHDLLHRVIIIVYVFKWEDITALSNHQRKIKLLCYISLLYPFFPHCIMKYNKHKLYRQRQSGHHIKFFLPFPSPLKPIKIIFLSWILDTICHKRYKWYP